jgi:hypothetical protein
MEFSEFNTSKISRMTMVEKIWGTVFLHFSKQIKMDLGGLVL